MRSFRCWRLRARLVDFAEGRLGERAREPIERHLAGCTDCAQTVLSLREVPAELRRLATPDPREQLRTRQRAGIMRAIGDSRMARRRHERVASGAPPWVRIAVPLAASVVLILIVAQWRAQPRSLTRPQAEVDSISAEAVQASPTEAFSDELFEGDEASFAMSDTTDLDDLGAFFEDTAI